MRGERAVLTPGQVGLYLKNLMDRDRVLSGLLVRGEISGTISGTVHAIVDGDVDLNLISGYAQEEAEHETQEN